MKNISVITSIIGEGRELLIEQPVDDLVDYVAYTNQNSNRWNIKEPCDIFKDNKNNAKIHKLLIHKYTNTPVNFWIDGTIQLIKSPSEIVNELLTDEYDMVILGNNSRYPTIFSEGNDIIEKKTCLPHIVLEQLNHYSNKEFNHIRTDNKFIIRRNNSKCNKFNESWWAECSRYSFRDQLSFPYILSLHKHLKVRVINPIEYSSYFKYFRHSLIKYNY